jgi:hypothetical protein
MGEPNAGKPHVRFDEGAGRENLSLPLYSTGRKINSVKLPNSVKLCVTKKAGQR